MADRLQHCHGNLDGVAKPTLRKIGKITEGVWLLATSADLQWPGTQGGTVGHSPIDRFGRWYVGKMLEATLFDKQVRLEFLAVNQLVKPATALFAPVVFIRVMKHMLLKKRRRVENSF